MADYYRINVNIQTPVLEVKQRQTIIELTYTFEQLN